MKLGKISVIVFILFLIKTTILFGDDKIESVPLINLEELSPTFEEDKDELDNIEDKNTNVINNEDLNETYEISKTEKVYINLTALDKITAKTIGFKLSVGEKKVFGFRGEVMGKLDGDNS